MLNLYNAISCEYMMIKKIFLDKILLLIVLLALFTNSVEAQDSSLSQDKDTLVLTIESAMKIALSESPIVKISEKEVVLKKEINKEAYAALFPDINLSGTYSRTIKKQTMAMQFGEETTTIQVGRDNTYNGGMIISLPIFAPALYKTINLTKTDIDLATEKARFSKLDLINQIKKAFYQLLLAQDSYSVLTRSYRQAEANFNIVNAKFIHGTVSEFDKIRAEVQMRNLKPSVVSAHNGVNLAKLQLKVLMGIDANYELVINGGLKEYEMEMFITKQNNVYYNLSNNSDLKQLDLSNKLLQNTLKLQQTNFMPTLSASFNYLYMSMNDNFRISSYDWYPYSTFGLSLTIPLYKASNFNKLKQTKIQIQQLALNRLNLERQLNMKISSYLDNMNASSEQVMSNKESVAQAEKGRQIASKRYDVGKGTILELNDSELALTQAQLVYNQSIYDFLVAKADLELVLGE